MAMLKIIGCGIPGESSLLFVCLGNICRSPLAEDALRAEAARRGLALTVDSAGTGGRHAGKAPDRRAQATARRHGVDVSGLRARQVTPDDFRRVRLPSPRGGGAGGGADGDDGRAPVTRV